MSFTRKVTTVSVGYDPVSKRIGVTSPFDPDFVAKAKQLGGKWDGTSHRWMFAGEHDAAVRALCMEVYGTCDGAPSLTREMLEQQLAKHLAAVVSIQEQLSKLDGSAP